jgi:hypothetical protein
LKAGINNYTTIQSLSEYEDQLNISYNKLFLKSLVDSEDNVLIVNSTSLANKYYDYIQNGIISLELTDKEYMKYRFQPKMFCNDIYGTTELWGLLLKINNFNSIAEFNRKKIKVFGNNIFNVLNEILINEKENILKNNESVGI